MRLPDAPLRKIWAAPLAASLALVEMSCPVRVPPASGSLVPSAIVMSELPLEETPLIALEVWRAVAVLAFPVRAAVILPAEKFPLAPRATKALAALALEAVVAAFATFPEVDMVASMAFETVPTSAAVMLHLDAVKA